MDSGDWIVIVLMAVLLIVLFGVEIPETLEELLGAD